MSKTAKTIAGLSAVLVLLGGGLAAIMLTEPDDSGNSDSSGISEEVSEVKNENVVIIYDDKVTETDPETGDKLPGVIKTVDVKNKDGELHVIQNGAADTGAMTYALEGYTDLDMETSVIGTLANNANGLTTESIIEEHCTDPSRFGLETPAVTVDIKYETGTSFTMLIGNEAPKGGETYVMIKGSDTVYTVRNSALANYSNSSFDFVSRTLLETPDVTPIVNTLRIERDDLDYDICLEYVPDNGDSLYSGGNSASHKMVEPTDALLSVERSSGVISNMFGLYAKGIYSVHSQESDIAETGLKEPFCTVTMDCSDGNTHKLILSEPFNDGDDKCRYAMIDESTVIFIVKETNLPWATIKPVDIASTIFISSYVWSINEMKVSYGGEQHKMTIKQADPSAELESPKSEDFDAAYDGKTISAERFRQFYSFLISGNAESFAFDEKVPSGEPLAAVEYTDSYMKRTFKIEFYEYSAMKSLIVVDGKPKFMIARSYVDTLIENAKIIDGFDLFKMTWK